MVTLYMLFPVAVFAIGVVLIARNFNEGWTSTGVLSGVAFVLLALPGALAVVGL